MHELTKMPPQAPTIEKAVLGELMVDKDAIYSVVDLLRPDIFYQAQHKYICEAMLSLVKLNKPVDMLTVCEQLQSTGKLEIIGGPPYLVELTQNISSALHVEEHIRIVVDKYIRRDLIRCCSEYINRAFDGTTDNKDLLDQFQTDALNIGADFESKKESRADEIFEVIEVERQSNDKPKAYVKTHIDKINQSIGGFGKGTLTILAARPSHGKSSLALDLAVNQAKKRIPVAFFTLEMSKKEMANRIIAASSGLTIHTINRGKLSQEDWNKYYSVHDEFKEKKYPIYIDDTPALSINAVKAKVRRLYYKYKVETVYVDYLQLMKGDKQFLKDQSRYFGSISSTLKQLAMELDIAVVALSQLSRDIEKRPVEKQFANMSDLRSSGELEQDADTVAFLANFKVMGLAMFNGESTNGKALLDIAKARHGEPMSFIINKSENQLKWGSAEETMPF
jgi:replicative DNA helicase